MKTIRQLIDELERVTEALRGRNPEDFGPFLESMNERSRVLIQIKEAVDSDTHDAGPAELERLKSNYREGVRLNQKLLISRAALRAEFEKLTQNDQMLRSLQNLGSDPRGRLDIRG